MKSSITLGPVLAIAAIALGMVDPAFAQSTDTPAANAPVTTTTTATVPPDSAADAPAPAAETSASPLAPIGSTGLNRADSANAAFAKLDTADRGFLSRADVAKLPDFGNAFAQADHDRDGRLDRTEFVDAWSVYVGQAIAGGTTTGPTTAAKPIR